VEGVSADTTVLCCEMAYLSDTHGLFIFFPVITVPIMLAMGGHPGVVGATSAAMILFTTFASTTSFSIFGLILPDFAAVAFLVGFVSSYIGNTLMRQARKARSAAGKDFDRYSFSLFAIGGVVLVSALLMTIQVSILVNTFLPCCSITHLLYTVRFHHGQPTRRSTRSL
jgi:hypothetical protein